MDLEKLAIDWVVRCRFDKLNGAAFPTYKGKGLKFALFIGANVEMAVMASVWSNVANNYNYDLDKWNGDCDNYKQVG